MVNNEILRLCNSLDHSLTRFALQFWRALGEQFAFVLVQPGGGGGVSPHSKE